MEEGKAVYDERMKPLYTPGQIHNQRFEDVSHVIRKTERFRAIRFQARQKIA